MQKRKTIAEFMEKNESFYVWDERGEQATVKRESFDYTAWQRDYFDRMAPGQVQEEALAYARKHPHTGKGERL